MYFKALDNMPEKLLARVQNDNLKRMTGSRFIEACFFIGFEPGRNQDVREIMKNARNIFNEEEFDAFIEGYGQ